VFGHKHEAVELIGLIVPVVQHFRHEPFRSPGLQKRGPALPGSGAYEICSSRLTMPFGYHLSPQRL
jgi:hypothetical protein